MYNTSYSSVGFIDRELFVRSAEKKVTLFAWTNENTHFEMDWFVANKHRPSNTDNVDVERDVH